MKLRGENVPVKGYRYRRNLRFEEKLEQACAEMRERMARRKCWCGRPEGHKGAHRGQRKEVA